MRTAGLGVAREFGRTLSSVDGSSVACACIATAHCAKDVVCGWRLSLHEVSAQGGYGET
jgi:hypothetical protein